MGWGSSSIKTPLTADGTKPLAAQYRHTFTIKDVSTFDSVEITTRADDGLVLYVNGEEVARNNLPSGTLAYNSYATAAPRTSAAVDNPVTVTVPASIFTDGDNTMAAAVHSNYRSTADTSFALTAVTVLPEEEL